VSHKANYILPREASACVARCCYENVVCPSVRLSVCNVGVL